MITTLYLTEFKNIYDFLADVRRYLVPSRPSIFYKISVKDKKVKEFVTYGSPGRLITRLKLDLLDPLIYVKRLHMV